MLDQLGCVQRGVVEVDRPLGGDRRKLREPLPDLLAPLVEGTAQLVPPPLQVQDRLCSVGLCAFEGSLGVDEFGLAAVDLIETLEDLVDVAAALERRSRAALSEVLIASASISPTGSGIKSSPLVTSGGISAIRTVRRAERASSVSSTTVP